MGVTTARGVVRADSEAKLAEVCFFNSAAAAYRPDWRDKPMRCIKRCPDVARRYEHEKQSRSDPWPPTTIGEGLPREGTATSGRSKRVAGLESVLRPRQCDTASVVLRRRAHQVKDAVG